jgi:PAS domain-containing protein
VIGKSIDCDNPPTIKIIEMKREKRSWVKFLILLFCGCLFSTGTSLAKDANIFILHSYHQENPWTNNENNGFIQTLTSKLPAENINFSTEYLDTKRVPYSKEYQEFFFQYLKQKFVLYSPDVIFCSDDNALTFLLQFKGKLFRDVPVVFCGVNNVDIEKNLNRQQYTGVFEKKEIIRNLDLLKRINPQPGNIIFLGDGSSTHRAIEQNIIEDIASKFPELKFMILANNNLSYLIQKLKPYKEGVIFLTTIEGLKDEQDNIVPLRKTLSLIAGAGDFTIISMEDVYMEKGVLGGYVTSGFAQGEMAANLTAQILHGDSPLSIPLVKESPNEYMFNYPQMKRLGLSNSQLPEASTILNRPQSLYDHYRYWIWATILFLIFQSSVILILIHNIHKRKKAETSLEKAREELEHRVVERTDELALTNEQFRQSRDKAQKYLDIAAVMVAALNRSGEITMLNQKGCDILGISEQEAQGLKWFEHFLPERIAKEVKEYFASIDAG